MFIIMMQICFGFWGYFGSPGHLAKGIEHTGRFRFVGFRCGGRLLRGRDAETVER